jgi:hypothetical protein
MPDGQVLLHAREINRQYGSLKSLLYPKFSNIDCKKTTYIEIATDRFERKCMDMLPSNTNNALFGSGSHNFTLTYVKNDLFSELFFYFELKASPIQKDHNVQIICNWKRRQTTTIPTTLPLTTTQIISTTIPITRKRKMTTISMQHGGKLTRLDLIQHRPGTQDIHNDQIDVEDTPDVIENEEEIVEQQEEEGEGEGEQEEEQEEILTTTVVIKTKKPKVKQTSTSPVEMTTTTTTTSDDDEEWLRILSLADIDSQSPSKQLLSINNRTFVSAVQPSIINSDEKIRRSSSTSNALLMILFIIICLTFFILILYCLKIKQPDCIQRLKLNTNVAFLFCCEAGKLLFSSNNSHHQTHSISHTPTSTIGNRHRHRRHNRPSPSVPDYQSSEYYMDETGNNNCRTTQSIYDGGGKSIYSIDYDEEATEYTTKYDRHNDGGSC